MQIEQGVKLDYCDVLIKPKRSTLTSRRDVDLNREITFRHTKHSFNGVPVIASNMDGVGTFSIAKTLQEYNCLTAIRKHYTPTQWEQAVNKGLDLSKVIACTGTNAIFDANAEDYKNLNVVLKRWQEIKFICIDVANGYQENFVEFVKRVRNDFPDKVIIAGNVCTPNMVEELIISGADVVKVGIGPGGVCTTRIVTGVGYPQLSAVIECADAAHGVSGQIIADGGCTNPGDVAKAFGAGADFVMLGSMLSFHDEGEYNVGSDGKAKFYGMSSDTAMKNHGYRKDGYKTNEGKVVERELRGSVRSEIERIFGGLRSTCTYVGARRLKDLTKCTTFIICNRTHNTVFGDDWEVS